MRYAGRRRLSRIRRLRGLSSGPKRRASITAIGRRPWWKMSAGFHPPGGRALERFNETGMIVRLDFERRSLTSADIDNPGVFTRDRRTSLPRVGTFSDAARAFVGAVLVHITAEIPELGVFGFAGRAEQRSGRIRRVSWWASTPARHGFSPETTPGAVACAT